MKRRRVRSFLAGPGFVLCVSIFAWNPARAEPRVPSSPRTRVVLAAGATGCSSAWLPEVVAALRVELLDRFLEGPESADSYRAALSCSADSVTASVAAPGGETKESRAELARVPSSVRARIVALTVAELVRDLDSDAIAAPVPSLPRPPAIEPAESGRAGPAPSRAGAVELGPFAETSAFLGHGATLFGGGIRLAYSGRPFCAGFDAALLGASERFAPGSVQVLLSYGSAFLGWEGHWRRLRARLGAGYALGPAKVRGAAQPPTFAGTVTGLFTAPYGFADLQVVLLDALSLYARGQAGWVTSQVVGEVAGGADVTLGGAWVGAHLGLALRL